MPNIQITLEYEGTNYCGWQRQKNTRCTIQEIIESVLFKILHEKIELIAAGRTDAGVHARAQIANFSVKNKIPLLKLQHSLNSLLPEDIKVVAIRQVLPDFHSRYNAKSKTYRYTILNRAYPSVFLRKQVSLYPHGLDIKLMQEAGSYLVGEHDFTSFKNSNDAPDKSCVRKMKGIKIKKENDYIYMDFTANGFLRNMVRNIVGTLIEVGRGKLKPNKIEEILLSKNRKSSGPTAPACGLCLLKVKY